MKTIILTATLLFATSSMAQVIFPRVITFPNQVQLTINNYSQKDIRCSGSVFIYSQSGRFDSRFYSNTLYRGMSDYKYYYNFNNNDPFRNASHSINCYPY